MELPKELTDKKGFFALVLGCGIIVGAVWGYFAGGYAAREKIQPIVDVAFPPPPEKITSIAGTIRGVQGDVLLLSANDPRDYLPHSDGSPPKTRVFRVRTTAETPIVLRDYTKAGAGGGPLEFTVKLSSLTPGHTALVESTENIGDKEEFSASRIQVTQGFSAAGLSRGTSGGVTPSSINVNTLKAFSR